MSRNPDIFAQHGGIDPPCPKSIIGESLNCQRDSQGRAVGPLHLVHLALRNPDKSAEFGQGYTQIGPEAGNYVGCAHDS